MGKAKLTGGLGLSAGEREGKGKAASWLGQAQEEGGERAHGGSGPKGRKKEGGREGFSIFFLFQINFQTHFKIEFEFKLFCSKPHITKEIAPA